MTDIPRPRTLEFSAAAKEVWGDTTADLEALDELFSPHSFDEFREKPEVMRAVFEEARGSIKRLEMQLRKFLMTETFGLEHPYPTRNPKNDGIEAMNKANESLAQLYQLWIQGNAPFVQALYLNPIFWRAISEWFIRLTANPQNKHAAKALRTFEATAQMLGPEDKLVQLMKLVPGIQEFFRRHPVSIFSTDHLSLSELADLNIKIFETAKQYRQYDVPLSVCHEEDICREPICLTSAPIEKTSARYPLYDGEFYLYDKRFESQLIAPGVIDAFRPTVDRGMGTLHINLFGDSVTFAIDRFEGEIEAGMIGSEGLKALLGERTYEALRAYILFRYAQLVCDEEDFMDQFSEFITLQLPPPPARGPQRHPPSGMPPFDSPPPWKGKLPVRFFPRGYQWRLDKPPQEERDAEPTGRHIRGRHTEPHRRLLPFGWNPTQEAIEKAQQEGANLLEVFKTFTEETPEGPRERRYTYVTGHEFGNVPDAVRAVYRHRTLETLQPEKE